MQRALHTCAWKIITEIINLSSRCFSFSQDIVAKDETCQLNVIDPFMFL